MVRYRINMLLFCDAVNAGSINQFDMATGYNEWVYHPITLSVEEINDPLNIVSHFFEYDGLKGALKLLERWRDHVVKEVFAEDAAFFYSPTSLIYFYDLNLRLIDASFLIHQLISNGTIISPVQHSGDHDLYTIWIKLDETERLELSSTLKEFHTAYTLPQYRSQLSEWLYESFRSKDRGESLSAKNVIIVYEGLQRLYNSLWTLQYHLNFEDDIDIDEHPVALIEPVIQVPNLYRLIAEEAILKPFAADLIDNITRKVPSVYAIIFLGVPPIAAKPLHFLILTADDEPRQAQELAAIIEDACRSTITIVALVHYSSVLFKELEKQSPFFSSALSGKVIYLNGGLMLPASASFDANASTIKTTFNWQRWNKQGKDFLNGADYYLQTQSYGAALFSLHQCAACLLIAVIRGVLGYGTQTHNLARLLTITGMFTQEIQKLFDNSSIEPRFKILKNAYIDISYRDTFEPDTKAIETLYQDVKQLAIICDSIYQAHSALEQDTKALAI